MPDLVEWRSAYDPAASVMEGLEEDPYRRLDMAIAMRIGETLHQHYPNHLWEVRADSAQGIATVKIPFLMGPTLCYVLHLDKLDTDGRQVRDAGGEILERFKIPRSGIDLAAFVAASDKRVYLTHDPIPS